MYSHVWQEIKNEKDIIKRLFKRSEAFFDSYPKWIDMMNLVRHASVGNNPLFKEKFKTVLKQIIQPISHDLELLQRAGKISTEINCLETAYVLMGMAEYGAWLIYNNGYNVEDISHSLFELVMDGIQNKKL